MPRIRSEFDDELIAVLSRGGVAVIRTDTLYGLVASADNSLAVEKIYRLKHRDQAKSPIVLIADMSQLYEAPTPDTLDTLRLMWPGPYSIILPSERAPAWLRRDNYSVAYRVPAVDELRALLLRTGPLIAPSANPEGLAPAMSIEEAVEYFGEAVDLYVDGGLVTDARPSTLLRFTGNTFERLR